MSEKYNPQAIEKKWQAEWEATNLYRQTVDWSQPKHYALTMLPYPSGDLHVGHWYSMTPPDARARYMRMKGYNVLFPMGFDAFGLPAENAAIKHGIHPAKWTYANIERMRGQIKRMGAMFDWEREAISCDPSYYKWTQWFFMRLYEMGQAYRKLAPVDFCPSCNTTLAREQVWGEDRHCERCDTPVIKKELEQWYFRITDYADELLDFSEIVYPERVETMQTNWIGKSSGADVVFKTEQGDEMPIFTTRPDTLWGATFMVMAPEHPLVEKVTTDANRADVEAYVADVERLTDIDRESAEREKTGVFTGGYAINPVNNARIPIWVADYVLMGYGSGAIMAVPAHDQRDFEFATKYDLPIVEVIQLTDRGDESLTEAFTSKTQGMMVNSDWLNGTPVVGAIEATINWLEKEGIGKRGVNYRLRDWLISRQRYWGCPIPIIYCDDCGTVPVPYDELPVILPTDLEIPSTGESPLKTEPSFYEVACPACGRTARRETDTMDTFMCSSWYQYRYLSPNYDKAPFEHDEGAYWLPVDQYSGGVEHATMHNIYTRYFTMTMRDMGMVEFAEPMVRLNNQGMVLGSDGEKMSKSRGNVVAPDDLVDQYGADTVRVYLMFFSRWEQGGPWNYTGIKGPQRFLEDVWRIGQTDYEPKKEDAKATKVLRRKTHQTIEKVGHDIKTFSFNTAIAAMMELRNAMITAQKQGNVSAESWQEAVDAIILLLAPIAPHITEELWVQRGGDKSVHQQAWPDFDPAIAKEETITLVIQVNGKVRDKVEVSAEIDEATARSTALASPAIQRHLNGKEPRRVIVIRGRLVNIVV